MPPLTLAKLLEDLSQDAQLVHIQGDLTRILTLPPAITSDQMVGNFSLIRHHRIHILSQEDIDWLGKQPEAMTQTLLRDFFDANPPALILAKDCTLPPILREGVERHGIALLRSELTAIQIINLLRLYLLRQLGGGIVRYGVFMDVLGLGVLITGDPSVGKSELALELITRGHGLIADDAVEFYLGTVGIEGRCPELLRDYLEVRGLGLLNVRTIYGETACRRRMRLRLVAHLQRPVQGQETERLPLENEEEEILGQRVRKVILPVAAGRNLAVLIEAAARTTILQIRGVDSMKEFIERQRDAIAAQQKKS